MSETKFLVTLTHKKPLPDQAGAVIAGRIYGWLYSQGVEAGVNVREMASPKPEGEMRIRQEGDTWSCSTGTGFSTFVIGFGYSPEEAFEDWESQVNLRGDGR
jgi:hypothetical protein